MEPVSSTTPATAPAGPILAPVLAIDYGRTRFGLAISDSSGALAQPFATWLRINRRRDVARLRELVRQQRIACIVVGLPLHLDGTASEMSEETRGFARRLHLALGIPVHMMDERLSSWEAAQIVNEAPLGGSRSKRSKRSSKPRNNALDEVAAAVILRDFLQQQQRLQQARVSTKA